MKYADEDGDLITIGSDLELQEAVHVASKQGGVLRLTLLPPAAAPMPIGSSAEKKEAPQPQPQAQGQGQAQAADVFKLLGEANVLASLSQLLANPQVLAVLPQLLPLLPAFLQQLSVTPSMNMNEVFSNMSQNPQAQQNLQAVLQAAAGLLKQNAPPAAAPAKEQPPIPPQLIGEFICHVTVPEETAMEPNFKFVKTWRVRNAGEVAWPAGTSLAFVNGDRLSDDLSVHIGRVEPHHEVDVSVNMVAPPAPGKAVSYWRLRSPEGTYFSNSIWAAIIITDPSPPPQPQAVAGSPPSAELCYEKWHAEFGKAKGDRPDLKAVPSTDSLVGNAPSAPSVPSTPSPSPSPAPSPTPAPAATTSALTSSLSASTSPMPPSASLFQSQALATPVSQSATTIPPQSAPIAIPTAPAATTQAPSSTAATASMLLSITPEQLKLANAQRQNWEEQLRQLEEMGFCNREKNIELLLKNGGNIVQTVQDLLSSM